MKSKVNADLRPEVRGELFSKDLGRTKQVREAFLPERSSLNESLESLLLQVLRP